MRPLRASRMALNSGARPQEARAQAGSSSAGRSARPRAEQETELAAVADGAHRAVSKRTASRTCFREAPSAANGTGPSS